MSEIWTHKLIAKENVFVLDGVRPLQHWARNIRVPRDFKSGVQFLKYVLGYCLTRLDAISNGQIHAHYTVNEAATEDPVQNTPATNTDDTTVLNNNTAAVTTMTAQMKK